MTDHMVKVLQSVADECEAEMLKANIEARSAAHKPTAILWKELIEIRTRQLAREIRA